MRLLFAVPLAIVTLVAAEQDKADIRVLSVGDNWTRLDDRGKPVAIAPYASFPPGQVNCKGSSGTLEVLAGSKTKVLTCLSSQIVTIDQDDPNQKEFPFFSAIRRLVIKGPALYTPTMARGGASIPDAVVVIQANGSFDAGPLIASLRAGRYRLKLSSLQQRREGPITVDVESGHSLVKAEDVKTGPYRLQVVTADDNEFDAGPWAAVFFTTPEDPARAAQAFQDVGKVSGGLSPEARRALMTLTFTAIAEQPR